MSGENAPAAEEVESPGVWRRSLGLLGLAVAIELLVPAELFYRTLGVSPSDAGLQGITVLLERSALVLALFALAGAGWAISFFVMMYPFVVTGSVQEKLKGGGRRGARVFTAAPVMIGIVVLFALGLLGAGALTVALVAVAFGALALSMPVIVFGRGSADRKEAHRETMKWGRTVAVGGLAFGAITLLMTSILSAIPVASEIKNGSDLRGSDFFLWEAQPVKATWTVKDPVLTLPSCHKLTYLGEGGRRILLYDSRDERALRINSSELELSFPDNC